MNFKQKLLCVLACGALLAPLGLSAQVDFEWRLSLNNRYHADPYGYRYGLADRFRMPESRVIVVIDSVREPSDAYMIFRLAELSGRPYDYVLGVYRQNRYASWVEIASLVGVIVTSREFNDLRYHHDLRDDYRYDNRRHDRYEDRGGVVIKREEIYVPQVYHEQQQMYRERSPHDDRYDDHRNPNHRDYDDDRHDDRRH